MEREERSIGGPEEYWKTDGARTRRSERERRLGVGRWGESETGVEKRWSVARGKERPRGWSRGENRERERENLRRSGGGAKNWEGERELDRKGGKKGREDLRAREKNKGMDG